MRRYHGDMIRGVRLFAVLLLLLAAATSDAQPRDPIRYTVRFPAPHTNYLEVEAIVPADGRASIDMFMAVWTPGSYLIREYARNVEAVAATAAGRSLAVEKTSKNRWRIAAAGAREITLTYRVFSHEMTVRTNWVEADFALINGAATFMTLAPDAGLGFGLHGRGSIDRSGSLARRDPGRKSRGKRRAGQERRDGSLIVGMRDSRRRARPSTP